MTGEPERRPDAAGGEALAAIAAAVAAVMGETPYRVTALRWATAPAWSTGAAWRLTARQAGLREEGMRQ